MAQISDRDWKTAKKLSQLALERYSEATLRLSNDIIQSPHETAHQRYRRLSAFLHAQDKEMSTVFGDVRRSNAEVHLLSMMSLGLFTDQDLGEVSPELQERLQGLLRTMGTTGQQPQDDSAPAPD